MPLWHTSPGCLAYLRRRLILANFGRTCRAFIGSCRHKYRYNHNNPHTAELQAKKGGFTPPICFQAGISPSEELPPFLCLVHVLHVPTTHTACLFSFLPWYHLHFLYSTFPAVFPCAICFNLEMHKLQQCKDDYNGVPCLDPFACTTCRRYKLNCLQYSGNCHNNGI